MQKRTDRGVGVRLGVGLVDGLTFSTERLDAIEHDVRRAAYEVRDLKGSAVHGIGLTVSGLIHATAHETGALIPVSVRVGVDVCASLPCVLGPDGPSPPLMPVMTEREQRAWEHTLEVLAEANRARFTVTSKVNDGTLVEVAFPTAHVLAE